MSENTPEGRLVHEETFPVRWGDQDAYGHVNNTVYFRFFEEARIRWFDSQTLTTDGQGEGPVIVTTGATFHQELVYPATIRVEVRTGRAGNSSLETFYRVLDAEAGTLYASGSAKVVWINHDTGRPTPLPDRLRTLSADSGL
ncbi:acyl-CoA thioesterase [Halomonadaceae bacterium KBTZ08]